MAPIVATEAVLVKVELTTDNTGWSLSPGRYQTASVSAKLLCAIVSDSLGCAGPYISA